MRRLPSIIAGIGCASALIGLVAAPAGAGTVTFPVDSWSVTFTIPDFTYTGNDCERAPWSADIQGPTYMWSLISLTATPRPALRAESAAPAVIQDTILVCPGLNGTGVFDVAGEATIYDTVSHKGSFATTFQVNPMPTTTVLNGYAPAGQYSWTNFTGRVVAHSTRLGDIGAYPTSQVVLEEQVGGGAWTRVAQGILDDSGSFSLRLYRAPTPGAVYRASYLGSTIFHATTSSAPSVSNTIVAPAAPAPPPAPAPAPVPQTPTVKVKAVSGKSKLYVDVDPDRGTGYWTFRVQRKNPDRSWHTVKTYRTEGSRETRTIDLKKGAYRVRMNAQYGYRAVTSDVVHLRR